MIKLYAPAKLTRNLFITGVRKDSYHLIRSEMLSLDLVDELLLELSEDAHLEVENEIAWINSCDKTSLDIPTNQENLVLRACELLGIKAKVKLKKRIPPGAGLGGGSSDAAAVLRWGSYSDLEKASRLGADVPFCLNGKRALVEGIGEQITELDHLDLSFVIITPRLHVPTPDVYRAYDEIHMSKTKAVFTSDKDSDTNHNDLEEAALLVEPELVFWRDYLAEIASRRPSLAGSGSSWFFELEEHEAGLLEKEISQAVQDDNLIAMVVKANSFEL